VFSINKKMNKYNKHMKRAEALYALGDTSKGHLHEEHASLYYGFGTKKGLLDRLKRDKKKPSHDITQETHSITQETHSTAESVWQNERLLLEQKLSNCEKQLSNCEKQLVSCKDDLESQIRLNNSNMTRLAEKGDEIRELEKKLKKEQTTDPKLTVMQETDTNPNDTQSADSERLTLDELQAHRIHPNLWNR